MSPTGGRHGELTIDPDQNTITVYYPNGERLRLLQTDQLSGGDILPDFSAPIAEIFA